MVVERNPELRYYCPFTNVYFRNVSFCKTDFRVVRHEEDRDLPCKYFKGSKDVYGKPLTIITILCEYDTSPKKGVMK